ncbi:FUSC family protein [Capnocytophaga canimorsus]|uniref:Inner membrane protein yccS n=1 Tax=Capnocytophaga canimorsus TaxID=28188 RepID=A0A0B7IAT3_9FLAO|nr:FUSC family membrane protein [Capnocytophaga canimorsus]CEN47819.1 Inner membrane protein yccS [Capnocytophaga canimorsus]
MFTEIKKFLTSFSFFKGILKTIALLVPIAFGWYCGDIAAGIAVGMTIVVISPSDIPGNRKHHIGGLMIATLLAMLSSFLVNITYPNQNILLLTIFGLTFFNAYISLYGYRASMVAISGLFSIATTLAHIRTGTDIHLHLVYVFLGGCWFIALVLLYVNIKPRQYSEQLLGKCFSLTADFFSVRADLLMSENRESGFKRMIDLQTQLNENYEKLREELLDSRSKSGRTNYLHRQFLMFIELVDIFELALAHPVQYEKLDHQFGKNKAILKPFSDFLKELSRQLNQMSVYIGSRKKIKLSNELGNLLTLISEIIKEVENKQLQHENNDTLLTLKNFQDYLENQYKSIKAIRVIFENYYQKDFTKNEEKAYRKFVSIQDYSLKRLKDHLSWKSSFFRHALRLSVTILVAYLIGQTFSLQNAYWIIFTVFIIMRPGFGLTKQRSLKRIYGTFVGGAIAFIIIYTLPYPNLYAVIGVLAMPFAFGLIQENYTTGSVFVTISVVFLYALHTPDVYNVLQYRILDTLIGATLAATANYFILPWWEHHSFNETIEKSIQANINYLKAFKNALNTGRGITNAYKYSRKEAFLRLSNLNASFQRMMQEPKSKQKDSSVYKIAVIQQSFLATIASLGIRLNNENLSLPKSAINLAIDDIIMTLEISTHFLRESESQLQNTVKNNNLSASKSISKTNTMLISNEMPLHDVYLYNEQINYLHTLAENLLQAVKKRK